MHTHNSDIDSSSGSAHFQGCCHLLFLLNYLSLSSSSFLLLLLSWLTPECPCPAHTLLLLHWPTNWQWRLRLLRINKSKPLCLSACLSEVWELSSSMSKLNGKRRRLLMMMMHHSTLLSSDPIWKAIATLTHFETLNLPTVLVCCSCALLICFAHRASRGETAVWSASVSALAR